MPTRVFQYREPRIRWNREHAKNLRLSRPQPQMSPTVGAAVKPEVKSTITAKEEQTPRPGNKLWSGSDISNSDIRPNQNHHFNFNQTTTHDGEKPGHATNILSDTVSTAHRQHEQQVSADDKESLGQAAYKLAEVVVSNSDHHQNLQQASGDDKVSHRQVANQLPEAVTPKSYHQQNLHDIQGMKETNMTHTNNLADNVKQRKEEDSAIREGDPRLYIGNFEQNQVKTKPRISSSDSEASVTNSLDVMQKRTQHLRAMCERLTYKKSMGVNARQRVEWNLDLEENFFTAVKHKLAYCAVQKVASSLWKRIFRIINGEASSDSVFNQSGLGSHIGNDNFSFVDTNDTWKNSFLDSSLTFLFVRHPLARTFSAYMDKVFLPYGENSLIELVDSSSQTGMNDTPCNLQLKIPSFSKFLRKCMLVAHLDGMDPHYTPIHTHCKPCYIRYDVVGHLESVKADTEYILEKVGLRFSHVGINPITFENGSDLSIMRDISWRMLLSPTWKMTREKGCWTLQDELLQRLWTIFKTRGLIASRVAYPFTGQNQIKLSTHKTGQVTFELLLQAIKTAYETPHNKELRLQQRDLAMKEAYASLPETFLPKLVAFHKVDCELFGYDCSLKTLLSYKQTPKTSDSFFQQWT